MGAQVSETMNAHRFKFSAFSLLEVIVAVAIFSGAVTVLLGLLPELTRQSAVSADALNALRLPDAIRVELTRVGTTGGFEALANQIKPLATSLPDTCELVATRDAARLHTLVYLPPPVAAQIADESQYFLIEAWRFSDAPLAFDQRGAVLALHVRVSWPYRIPGALAITPFSAREWADFNVTIVR